MLAEAQRLGLALINVHKGLPALFAPGSEEYVRDAATSRRRSPTGRGSASSPTTPATSRATTRRASAGSGVPRGGREHPRKQRKRVYAEIGSTFAIVLRSRGPRAPRTSSAQLLQGARLEAASCGAPTRSGGARRSGRSTPSRRSKIPQQMQEQFGYPALTEKRKSASSALNAARALRRRSRRPRAARSRRRARAAQQEQGGMRAIGACASTVRARGASSCRSSGALDARAEASNACVKLPC